MSAPTRSLPPAAGGAAPEVDDDCADDDEDADDGELHPQRQAAQIHKTGDDEGADDDEDDRPGCVLVPGLWPAIGRLLSDREWGAVGLLSIGAAAIPPRESKVNTR